MYRRQDCTLSLQNARCEYVVPRLVPSMTIVIKLADNAKAHTQLLTISIESFKIVTPELALHVHHALYGRRRDRTASSQIDSRPPRYYDIR